MTDRLTEIKERAEKATPGPWTFWSHVGLKRSDRTVLGENFQGVEFGGMNRTLTNRDDSVFIAHSRTDIPFLLAEVKRLKSELDSSTLRLAFRSGDLAHAKAEVERLRGIIEEAREFVKPRVESDCDWDEMESILSRVSQVEDN